MTKAKARKIITECASLYNKNLCDKELIFVYLTNSGPDSISVIYRKKNYKHLTGIVSKHLPEKFFNSCYLKTISENEISFNKNGTTTLKLEILECIMNIAHQVKFLGDYLNSNIYLEVDKIVGNTSIGLGVEKGEHLYYPKSVLKGDMRKQIRNMIPVSAVLEKQLNKPNSNYSCVHFKNNLSPEQKQTLLEFIDNMS